MNKIFMVIILKMVYVFSIKFTCAYLLHEEKQRFLPHYLLDNGFNGTVVNQLCHCFKCRVIKNYKNSPFNNCCRMYPGYSLIIIGYSLGAGVSHLVSINLLQVFIIRFISGTALVSLDNLTFKSRFW